ncbi:hypothetical protein FOZ60_006679 [Perkinsus olseni]|uniref:Uncharacterized protein n=3 Tax=Perkinsus olseni TaxID=32597 RepID=A0A7J6NQF4_PEROL|nr:hypothetical protein FOZ60_006679 [Perkinsus olseni]
MSATAAAAPVGSLLVPFVFGYAAQSGLRYGREIYSNEMMSESSVIRRPFPRSVNAIEKVWDSGREQMRKATDEMERLKALAREGLENAGLAESVEKNYAKFWPPVRDSLLIPAGVGATAFWTATRSGQLAAYLSTITSKMPITGRLTGYSIIFGSGAVVGKTAHYLARQPHGGDLDEQGSLADEFSYWDTPTTVRDGIVALLVFTMLGGTWRSVLPSSVLYRGSFWSPLLEQALPGNLRSSRGSVRHVTTTLGKSLGCHTCGSKVGPFVSDLCPPTAAISSGFGRTWLDRITGGVKQYYLPQCSVCSGIQSRVLYYNAHQPLWYRSLMIHDGIVMHLGRLRSYDLTGLILGVLLWQLYSHPEEDGKWASCDVEN